MKRVLSEITPILEKNFDMEMVEKHHNKKLDAPSGTAKMLVAAMNPDGAYGGDVWKIRQPQREAGR